MCFMASRRDSEKIRLIRILRNRAKSNKVDLYKLLARKDELYEKAIKAQRWAGLATMGCGIIGFTSLIALTIFSSINAGINVDVLSYIIIAVIFLAIILPITLKTSSLTTTPTTMLVLTIIQLIISIFLFSGIAPLVALILNIIALVRWSTYRNWYDEVSVEYYKGKKQIANKPQRIHRPKNIYDFSLDDDGYEERQKKPVGLIVSLIFVIILGIGGCIGCFYWGRNGGWIDGYSTGKNDGLNDGYQDGYNDGKSAGYTWAQMSERYQTGYNNGYNDGYRKAGCIIYGVYCN